MGRHSFNRGFSGGRDFVSLSLQTADESLATLSSQVARTREEGCCDAALSQTDFQSAFPNPLQNSPEDSATGISVLRHWSWLDLGLSGSLTFSHLPGCGERPGLRLFPGQMQM